MQERLNQAAVWASSHQATFDMAKAGCMIFGGSRYAGSKPLNVRLHTQQIPVRDQLKILGVTIQHNLRWESHV